MSMLTMTSLVAQSQFGTLIDTSQRQPVAVTRRGRPIAVVQSYEDYLASRQTIPFHVATLISTSYPLRGQEATASMSKHLKSMGNQAAQDGLTEKDIMQMLYDE